RRRSARELRPARLPTRLSRGARSSPRGSVAEGFRTGLQTACPGPSEGPFLDHRFHVKSVVRCARNVLRRGGGRSYPRSAAIGCGPDKRSRAEQRRTQEDETTTDCDCACGG